MEKNRNILIDALSKLPVYQPEEIVWEGVEVHLESKFSSTKLPLLSEIEPPESIWDNIDKKLSKREKISALTEYNPPEKVWENIDKDLSLKNANHLKRQIFQWAKWSSAVAAIFTLGFFIFNISNSSKTNLNYSEEWLEITELQNWNDDEISVEYALTLICEENPLACKSPEFKEMDNELTFLNQSKQAIIEQLNKYDTNTELELMLTEIELERSSLIKEMIAQTI